MRSLIPFRNNRYINRERAIIAMLYNIYIFIIPI